MNNKKILIGLFVLLFVSFTSSVSADQLSFDGFESGNFCGGSGWIDNCWTTSGSVSIIGWTSPYEGNRHTWLRGNNALLTRTVDISGYGDVVVKFAVKINSLESTDKTTFRVAVDGGSYINIKEWTSVDSDSTWHYYSFNLADNSVPLGNVLTLNFFGQMSDLGDETHIDSIMVEGTFGVTPEVAITMDANYPINSNAIMSLSSTEANTLHTLELYDSNNQMFCQKNLMSPLVANTIFTTDCTMPESPHTDAYALLYTTNNPSLNITDYFNIVSLSNNFDLLKIKQVYFSPQVLQGGSTEIFTVLEKSPDVAITKLKLQITFPNNSTRELFFQPTGNVNEYRAFITDTFLTGFVDFKIVVESEMYHDEYINSYYVVPFSVEYVANVGNVSSVGSVDKLNIATMEVFGTEYDNTQEMKVWLQLLDIDGEYVNDGICYASIYTPDNKVYVSNVLMTVLNRNGIYYYDAPAPEKEGVYPVVAKCYYESLIVKYFSDSFTIGNGASSEETIATDDFECGSFSCGTGWNSAWSYTGTCDITTNANPIGTYQMRGYKGCNALRRFDNSEYESVNVSFYATATSLESGEYCRYYYFDGTTNIELLSITDGDDLGVPIYYEFDISAYDKSAIAGIRMNGGPSTGDYCYMDSVTITGNLNQDLTDLEEQDGESMIFVENIVGGISRINNTFTFNNLSSCTEVDESLLTGLAIYLYGKFDSVPNDDITISIWNYTSSSWLALDNKLLEGSTFKLASNLIELNNITSSGLYDAVEGVKIRTQDSTYADVVNNYFYIDYLYVGCDQISSPSWQEVKGSGEIHVASKNEYKFYIETLCGNARDEYSESSACAEFKYDDSYWNYTWGYIYENITFINNYQSEINDVYYYTTQLGQDCTGLIDITKTINESTNSIYDLVTVSAGQKENCVIGIPVVFDEDERSFEIVITQDNYMTWENQRNKDIGQYYHLIVEPFCEEIALAKGVPFTIPIQEELGITHDVSTLYANEPLYLGCYRALDDFYWFETYYNDSLDIDVAGEFESYLLESRYYYPLLIDYANTVQSIKEDPVSLLFSVTALCGNAEESICAIAYPADSYFTSEEGYIVENLSITNNFNTMFVGDYKYETVEDIDCSAILEVLWVHQNGTQEDITDDIIYGAGGDKNCVLNVPISFETGETHSNVLIYMENYIHWNTHQMVDKVGSIRYVIEDFCSDVEINNNITFNLPVTGSIHNISSIQYGEFCYRALDDLYWWDFFNELHLEDTLNHTVATTVGNSQASYFELIYFYPFIQEDVSFINNVFSTNLATDTLELINITTEGIVFISGTEYASGEEGMIGVRLIRNNGVAETGATCDATILYPNLTSFASSVSMSEYGDGVYSYNFTVPDNEGVYIYYVDCENGLRKYKAMSTFHVAGWANQISDIYDTVIFINSTTIEINGTTHNIYNYLQGTIYSILTEINYTINNLNVTATVDLSSIETKLLNVENIVTKIDEFTSEQIFLITDSVGMVQASVKDTNSKEQDIINNLNIIKMNLDRFNSIEENKKEVPNPILENVKSTDIMAIVLVGIILSIIIISQLNNNKLSNRKQKQKIQELKRGKDMNLPSIRGKTINTVRGETQK